MIVLVGFMGAGKTTVGRALAAALGRPFVDSDHEIERATGLSIPDIFDGYGEAGFRDLEAATIARLLAGPEVILALGGGAVTDERTRVALHGHTVVFLQVSLADALARVGGDPGRPVLRNPDLPAIFERRDALYRGVATLVVPAGGRAPRTVAAEIAELLASGAGTSVDPVGQDRGE